MMNAVHPWSSMPFSQVLQPRQSQQDGSRGRPDMRAGANYFFGFLVTFVVLLLIFIACGVGTRRRFLRRQQRMMEHPENDLGWFFSLGSLPTPKTPTLYDSWVKPTAPLSTAIQPLSVVPLWSSSADAEAKSTLPASSSPPERHSPHALFNILPLSSILHRRRATSPAEQQPSSTSNRKEKEPTEEFPDALRWTMLISMPSQGPPPRSADDEPFLPEYLFGVSSIPWKQPVPSLPTPS